MESLIKFLKSKLFIGILCLIVALAVGFGGVPLINSVTNKQVSAVRFKTELKKGEIITAENIETVRVSPVGLPAGSISDTAEALDKYLVTDAQMGDYLTAARVSAEHPYSNDYLFDLPKGQLAVSFTLDSFASGISGKVMQGDIISLLSVVQGSGQGDELTVEKVSAEGSPALAYLKVLAATSDIGEDTDGEKTDADKKLILPATVTVLATAEQARLIVGLEQNGTIQLALVSRGNAAYADELLAIQNDYLAQMEAARLADAASKDETAQETPPALAPSEVTAAETPPEPKEVNTDAK